MPCCNHPRIRPYETQSGYWCINCGTPANMPSFGLAPDPTLAETNQRIDTWLDAVREPEEAAFDTRFLAGTALPLQGPVSPQNTVRLPMLGDRPRQDTPDPRDEMESHSPTRDVFPHIYERTNHHQLVRNTATTDERVAILGLSGKGKTAKDRRPAAKVKQTETSKKEAYGSAQVAGSGAAGTLNTTRDQDRKALARRAADRNLFASYDAPAFLQPDDRLQLRSGKALKRHGPFEKSTGNDGADDDENPGQVTEEVSKQPSLSPQDGFPDLGAHEDDDNNEEDNDNAEPPAKRAKKDPEEPRRGYDQLKNAPALDVGPPENLEITVQEMLAFFPNWSTQCYAGWLRILRLNWTVNGVARYISTARGIEKNIRSTLSKRAVATLTKKCGKDTNIERFRRLYLDKDAENAPPAVAKATDDSSDRMKDPFLRDIAAGVVVWPRNADSGLLKKILWAAMKNPQEDWCLSEVMDAADRFKLV